MVGVWSIDSELDFFYIGHTVTDSVVRTTASVEVVGLSKLHILYQSYGRQANRSFDCLASVKVFVLQRLIDILGLVI